MIENVLAEIARNCAYAAAMLVNEATGAREYIQLGQVTPTIGTGKVTVSITIAANAGKKVEKVFLMKANSTNPDTASYTENVNALLDTGIVHTVEITADLPEGYTICQYLESDGNQYIDTGYAYLNADFEIECRYMRTGNLDTEAFGVSGNATTAGAHGQIRGGGAYLGNGKVLDGFPQIAGTEYFQKASFSASTAMFVVTVNGETKTYNGDNGWIGTRDHDFLFASNHAGLPKNHFVGRIYYHIMRDRYGTARQFFPCLDENGKPCMFDIIGQKAYYNSGSGEFKYKAVGSITDVMIQNVLDEIKNDCAYAYIEQEDPVSHNKTIQEISITGKTVAGRRVEVNLKIIGTSNQTATKVILRKDHTASSTGAIYTEDINIPIDDTGFGGPMVVHIHAFAGLGIEDAMQLLDTFILDKSKIQ